mgnify:CR=1 FL=1
MLYSHIRFILPSLVCLCQRHTLSFLSQSWRYCYECSGIFVAYQDEVLKIIQHRWYLGTRFGHRSIVMSRYRRIIVYLHTRSICMIHVREGLSCTSVPGHSVGYTIQRDYRVPRYKVILYDTRYRGHCFCTPFGTVSCSLLMFGT